MAEPFVFQSTSAHPRPVGNAKAQSDDAIIEEEDDDEAIPQHFLSENLVW